MTETKGDISVKCESQDELDINADVDEITIFVNERKFMYDDITEEEIRKTTRKCDWVLLPLLFFTATTGATDKVILSSANIYGLGEVVTTYQYSWLGMILFLGSLVSTWPISAISTKVSKSKLLTICCLLWSSMTLLLSACNSFAPMLVLRFLMGVFESAIVPGCTLLIANFYSKKQQPVRLAIIFAFGSSVFNGFLSWLTGYFKGLLPKWKYLFIMVGSISFTWACFMIWYLPEAPMNAKFLTDRQKFIIARNVIENRTGVKNNKFKPYQLKEAFLDVKLYIVFLFNVGINIPNGGLNNFNAIIINKLFANRSGSPTHHAMISSLLGIPTGVVATLATVVFNYLCGKTHNLMCFWAGVSLIVPIIGAVISYTVLESNVAARLVGLYFMYFYFASYIIMSGSLSSINFAGQTKRSVSIYTLYAGYATGAILGTKSFTNMHSGFTALLCAYVACLLLVVLYYFACVFENRKKMKVIEADPLLKEQYEEDSNKSAEDRMLLDLTDKEQKTFLYTT